MAAVEHGILEQKSLDPYTVWWFNGQPLEDCNNMSLLEVLNYLGQDEWQFSGSVPLNVYVMVRR